MKTLILRNRGFGDALWTEPVVGALLDQGHEVNLFLEHTSVFENYPSSKLHFNDFYSLCNLEEKSILLNLGTNSKKHILEVFLQQAGISETKLRCPRLYLTESEKKRRIQPEYALLHLDLYLGHPMAFGRNVYGIDWEKVTRWIRSKGLEPLQISARDTLQVAPRVPTNNWRDIMSFMLHAKLFVGLDSGPSHIAAVMGIPSLIFFGFVNPKYRHLDDHKKVFMQNPCPFAHCYHETRGPCRRVPVNEPPPCTVHTADSVIQAIESLLD